MSSPFLVRGAATFRGDRTLRLRIHRRKSARCLPDGPGIARLSVVIGSSFTRSFVATADSASLVQFALVVSFVCHYPSPAAIFELKVPAGGCASRVRCTDRSEAGISRVF
jgi:hypothetical protein